jgi:hypothetical protein
MNCVYAKKSCVHQQSGSIALMDGFIFSAGENRLKA